MGAWMSKKSRGPSSQQSAPTTNTSAALVPITLRRMRGREERALAHLRSLEPHASQGPTGSYLTLQMGIGLAEWTIEWCRTTERRLAAEAAKEK